MSDAADGIPALARAYQCIAAADLAGAERLVAAQGRTDVLPIPWQVCLVEILGRRGRYREAIQVAEAILSAGAAVEAEGREAYASNELPPLLHTLGRLHLGLGDFQKGLSYFEAVRPFGLFGDPPPPMPAPRWRGEPLANRTLCLAVEGGLGDAVCFGRFARDFERLGAQVVLAIYPELAELFQPLLGQGQLIDRTMVASGAFDYWLPALSSPLALGYSLGDLTGAPYLVVPAAAASRWRRRVGSTRLRVGLCWQGRREFCEDALRSIPATLLGGLLAVDGVDWYKLQLWEGENVLAHPRLIDLTRHISSPTDLAALAQQLDLVISVDSGPAHLAAALGVETWLLNRQFGWITFSTPVAPAAQSAAVAAERPRWQESPWYRTMRVYTQCAFGRWGEVLERVTADLAERVSSWPPPLGRRPWLRSAAAPRAHV